jgi:hypothetical protein
VIHKKEENTKAIKMDECANVEEDWTQVHKKEETLLLINKSASSKKGANTKMLDKVLHEKEANPPGWGDSADHLAYRGRAEEPVRQRAM